MFLNADTRPVEGRGDHPMAYHRVGWYLPEVFVIINREKLVLCNMNTMSDMDFCLLCVRLCAVCNAGKLFDSRAIIKPTRNGELINC